MKEITSNRTSQGTSHNENELQYPAIYKHFKNKYYAVMGFSNPLEKEEIKKYFKTDMDIKLNNISLLYTLHTEIDEKMLIININGYLYHELEKEKNQLVLYKSLYDDSGIYVRPIADFLSEVDKEKYPDIKQKYKFEIFKY